jgi:hypothetical protein
MLLCSDGTRALELQEKFVTFKNKRNENYDLL